MVIVDERGTRVVDETEHEPALEPAAAQQPQSATVAPGWSAGARRAPDARAARSAPGAAERGEIAIRDARHEQGPAAWIHSIGQQLERFERDGLGFAVVLLELAGADPVGAVEADVEAALEEELQAAGGGALTREREGRYWMLVGRADRIGAHALAVRLERAVAAAAARRASSVSVASGTAICPEDGTQAAALAAHADIGLYAARWEARSAGAQEGLGE